MMNAENQHPPSGHRTLRDRAHPLCFVCAPHNTQGLKMEFFPMDDGSVVGVFADGSSWQGYSGLLHGGVIASLLDGAMTHCLFALGFEAVTAELKVRYRHPVMAAEKMTLRAWQQDGTWRLHVMQAELSQSGQVKAVATAKFVERPM